MKTYGLIGYPLTHSFSRSFFSEKFITERITDCTYENFSFEKIEDAITHLKNLSSLGGINVTIPHKRSVIRFLDDFSAVCREIESCNCIKITGNKWIGYNTDVTGFMQSIQPLLKSYHKNALILGTGGASKAVAYSFRKLGISYQYVSRNPSEAMMAYEQLNRETLTSHTIIVNTTPLGMYPHINESPKIPYQFLTEKHLVYDLIYNPEETLFLKKARERKSVTKNGMEMLVIQAEESWKIWNKPEISS